VPRQFPLRTVRRVMIEVFFSPAEQVRQCAAGDATQFLYTKYVVISNMLSDCCVRVRESEVMRM
jgi:hypothetical protein